MVGQPRSGSATAGPRGEQAAVVVGVIVAARGEAAVQGTNDAPVGVPDGAAGGAPLGGAKVPVEHLEVGGGIAARRGFVIADGERIVLEADALLVACRVMDGDRRCRCDVAAVPARPVGIGSRRRRLRQPQQGHVRRRIGGQQRGSALGRGGGRQRHRRTVDAAVDGATGWTLVFPVDHHRRGLARRRQAMVGGQEQRIAIAAAAVDQLPGAQEAAAVAAEGVAPDRANLLAPEVALRADGVDVAGPGLQRLGAVDAAIAVTDVRQFEIHPVALAGRNHQLEDRLAARYHRQRQPPLARIVGVGERPMHDAALGVAEPEFGALRQAPTREADVDAGRRVGADRQSPDQPSVSKRGPVATAGRHRRHRDRLDGVGDRVAERSWHACVALILRRQLVAIQSVEVQGRRGRRGFQPERRRLRCVRTAGHEDQCRKEKSHGLLRYPNR